MGLCLVLFAEKLSDIFLYRYKSPGFYLGPYKVGKKDNGKLGLTYAQTMSEALGKKKAVWFIRIFGIMVIILSFFVISEILKLS